MVHLKELEAYLNTFLPSEGISDYCPNGLQVEGKKEIKKIATAVSASLETIYAAVQAEADALIVHHGIFWNKDSYCITGTKKEKIHLLLEKGISLFGYHLPLDVHREVGNNWRAAQEMGWEALEPFGLMNKVAIGVKGIIDPLSREQMQTRLEAYYHHPATIVFGGKAEIKTVALISGSAHRNLIDAANEGIDAFITGTYDEPVWPLAQEEGINFYALGHSATERVGPRSLAEHLKNQFGIPCEFIDIPNPF